MKCVQIVLFTSQCSSGRHHDLQVHFPHLEEEREKGLKTLYLESISAVEGSKEEEVQTIILSTA